MCMVYLCTELLGIHSVPVYRTTRCAPHTCVQNHQMCTVYLCTKPRDVHSVPVYQITRRAHVYLCIIEMLCQLSRARPGLLSGWPMPATLESPPGTLHKTSSASMVLWCAPWLERASVLGTFSQTTPKKNMHLFMFVFARLLWASRTYHRGIWRVRNVFIIIIIWNIPTCPKRFKSKLDCTPIIGYRNVFFDCRGGPIRLLHKNAGASCLCYEDKFVA